MACAAWSPPSLAPVWVLGHLWPQRMLALPLVRGGFQKVCPHARSKGHVEPAISCLLSVWPLGVCGTHIYSWVPLEAWPYICPCQMVTTALAARSRHTLGSGQTELCEPSRTVSVEGLAPSRPTPVAWWLTCLSPLCSSSVPAFKTLGIPPAAAGTAAATAARGAEHPAHPAGAAGDCRRVLVHRPAPAAPYP